MLRLKHSKVLWTKISDLVCGESTYFLGMPAAGQVARLLCAVSECC